MKNISAECNTPQFDIVNIKAKNCYFLVVNRYWQKVFETREYGNGWDGALKVKALPAGSYVYRIQFTNIFGWESVDNGAVLLIR